MSKTIQHKRSSVAGNQPDNTQVAVGELAINFADRSIYTKDGSDVVLELARDIWRTDAQPDSALEGDFWYNTGTGELSFWNGSNWENPSFGGGTVDPDSASVEGGFTGGSGTESDPYTVETIYANVGDTGIHVATVTVPGLNPAQIVPLQDLNADENGGRYNADNQIADVNGVLTVNITFDDNPPSANANTYSGELKIGSNSIYINSDVVIAEKLEGGTDIDVPTGTGPTGPFIWQGENGRQLTASYPLLISDDGYYFTDQITVDQGDQIWVKWAGDPGSGDGIDGAHGTTISGAVTDGVGGAKFFYFTIDKETSFVFHNFVDSDQTIGGLSESRKVTVRDVNSYVYPFGTTTGDSAQYAVNGGDWKDMPATNAGSAIDYMVEGDEFQLRHRDAATINTASTYNFNMAGDSADWTTVTADVDPVIKQPTIEAPSDDGATGISTTGPFVSSDFEMASGVDVHTASSWQLEETDTWAKVESPGFIDTMVNRQQIYSMAWNGSVFVVMANDGYSATSSDAATWTAQTNYRSQVGNKTPHDIIWDGSKFITVGMGATNATSTDGINWTSHSSLASVLPGPYVMYAIVYDSVTGLYLAAGSSGYIASSTDGTTWTDRTSNMLSATTSSITVNSIATNGSIFVIVGDNARVATTTDGVSFQNRTSIENQTSGSLYDVAWNGSIFCVVGQSANCFTSTDGITWTQQTGLGTAIGNQYVYSIIWDGSQFIAAGGSLTSSVLATSPDGVNWTKANSFDSTSNIGSIQSLVYTGSKYVAGGYKAIATSQTVITEQLDSDGSALTSWTPSSALSYETDYKVRVRHHTATLSSEWSDYRSFKTEGGPGSNGFSTSGQADAGFQSLGQPHPKITHSGTNYFMLAGKYTTGNLLMMSSDLVTWTEITSIYTGFGEANESTFTSNGFVLTGIIYDPATGRLIVFRNGNECRWSDDEGATWNKTGTGNVSGMAYGYDTDFATDGNGTILAISGYSSSSTTKSSVSTDGGDTWTPGTQINLGGAYATAGQLMHDGNKFWVCGGADNDAGRIGHSTDGINWTFPNVSSLATNTSGAAQRVEGIWSDGNGNIVANTLNSALYSNDDGVTWQKGTKDASSQQRSFFMYYNGSSWFGFGERYIHESTNGRDWVNSPSMSGLSLFSYDKTEGGIVVDNQLVIPYEKGNILVSS